ncbi:MAG: hypothetical protein WBA76_07390 [Phormidesmis sp.]
MRSLGDSGMAVMPTIAGSLRSSVSIKKRSFDIFVDAVIVLLGIVLLGLAAIAMNNYIILKKA